MFEKIVPLPRKKKHVLCQGIYGLYIAAVVAFATQIGVTSIMRQCTNPIYLKGKPAKCRLVFGYVRFKVAHPILRDSRQNSIIIHKCRNWESVKCLCAKRLHGNYTVPVNQRVQGSSP